MESLLRLRANAAHFWEVRLDKAAHASCLEHHAPEGGLMWRPDKDAGHNEQAWRRRLPKALRFMFRR